MFIDELILTVQSGRGGDGCSAFRREKYVPLGGPAGGDGGNGGDVILRADPQLTTFSDMESDRVIRAQPGGPGMGGNCHGGDGETRIVGVPPGTTVKDAETGEVLVDLDKPGDTWLAVEGGRGGNGNSHYATATDQAPTRATLGGPGARRRLKLELRLLADAGLVGLPNAGKSTLLSRLSRATPRIADYPFTTLEPYLGLVELGSYRRFVLADLPGLIAGAHDGKGLGDRFLRHVERTRVLVHLVDLFPLDGTEPAEAYRIVRGEIEAYGHGLGGRPEIVAGTKCDADPKGAAAAARALSKAIGKPVIPISAVAGMGLPALVAAIADTLGAPRPDEPFPVAGGAPAAPRPPAAPLPVDPPTTSAEVPPRARASAAPKVKALPKDPAPSPAPPPSPQAPRKGSRPASPKASGKAAPQANRGGSTPVRRPVAPAPKPAATRTSSAKPNRSATPTGKKVGPRKTATPRAPTKRTPKAPDRAPRRKGRRTR